MELRIRAFDPNNYATVVITSGGGLASNASRITDYFNSHGKKIRIEFYCASSCADIVFMGASKVEVADQALVLFHYTSSYGYESYVRAHGAGNPSHSAKESKSEQSFYLAHKMDQNFLYKIAYSVAPFCVERLKSDEAETVVYYRIAWAVPSRSEVETYRGKFSGYWPSSPAEVGQAMADRGMLAKGQTIKYGMLNTFQFVHLCPANHSAIATLR